MKIKVENSKGIRIMNNKSTAGITLIALVITIIVLLILAGVSIAMLTGENGILTKATTASEETKQKGAEEKVKIAVAGSWGNDGKININDLKSNLNNVEGIDKTTIKDTLPMTVKVDGYEVTIENTGKVESNNGCSEETGSLPSTDDTKPYLPSDEFSKIDGTDLDTGLVIKDKDGNSYVWVEVPKSIYKTATSNTDYSNIEKDMQTYAVDYRKGSSSQNYAWTDTWYDGCGLTEMDYNNLKQTMLKSVYDNGGFWISQYEIGTETPRTAASDALTTPVSKEGAYVYNFVTVSQAQSLASQMNSGNYNSSLLYGIQWDLTLKYIETKGARTGAQLKTDSTEWGNYFNSTFDIAKGKYSTDSGKTFIEVTTSYTKPSSTSVLLTTGATNRNNSLNIYDIAGNVFEWTLEKSTSASFPASYRGGGCNINGTNNPASYRSDYTTSSSYSNFGVRLALY